jgi:hypothetical protein
VVCRERGDVVDADWPEDDLPAALLEVRHQARDVYPHVDEQKRRREVGVEGQRGIAVDPEHHAPGALLGRGPVVGAERGVASARGAHERHAVGEPTGADLLGGTIRIDGDPEPLLLKVKSQVQTRDPGADDTDGGHETCSLVPGGLATESLRRSGA